MPKPPDLYAKWGFLLSAANTRNKTCHSGTCGCKSADFLFIATERWRYRGSSTAWLFISQMNPDASVLALATIVDLAPIAEAESYAEVADNPVFIRHARRKRLNWRSL
jgi:hypothetical protein